MTRELIPRTCDFCKKKITSGMTYKHQISQRGGTKGKFTKASKDADQCHECFLEMCKTGYKPVWVSMHKVDDKWETIEPQEKIVEGGVPIGAIPR